MTHTPAITPSLCPERFGARCSRCLAACPTGAVSLNGEPAIAADLCRNCGACASVCPTGALVHMAADALSSGLPEEAAGATPVLACRKAGKCGAGEFPVPGCLSALGLETLLGLWLRGRKTVALITGDCSSCRSGDGGLTFRRLLGQAQAILARSKYAHEAPFTVTSRSEDTPPPHRENAVSLSRRGFLGLLACGKASTPERASQREPAGNKRIVLAAYLMALNANGPAPHGMPTGAIRGNGDCTACGACANVCATAALKLKEERDRTLEFTPALCVNCGACVKVCLPGFLHAAPSTLETISTTPVILFQGGVGTCKRCKAGSAILSNQEGYCPVCLHKMKMMNSL